MYLLPRVGVKEALPWAPSKVHHPGMTTSAIDDRALERATQDTLSWTRPQIMGQEHVLRARDVTLASIRFAGAFGRDATAEFAGQRWRFHPGSRFKREILVSGGAGKPVAVYHGHGIGHGELELADGNKFGWKNFSFWGREWGFTRNGEDPLVMFRFRFSWGRAEEDVVVDADARRLRELPLLLLFGRYLTVSRRKRSHAS